MSDEKNILGKELVHQERLRTMTNLYTTVDRMITGRRISVEPTDELRNDQPLTEIGNSPMGGQTIYFNASRLNEDDLNKIERLHGMNFHEVARSEYSAAYPRRADSAYKAAYQILEGTRTDNLFTATHRATGDWLGASVMRWISETDSPDEAAKIHLSTYGRDFMPADLRQAAAESFEQAFGTEARTEFEDVIDTYNGLVLPRDWQQAAELSQRYEELCRKYFKQSASQQPDPFDSGQQGQWSKSSQHQTPQQGTSNQQEAQQRRQDPEDGDGQQGGQGQGQGEQGDGDQQQGQGSGQGQQQNGDQGDQQGQEGGQGQQQSGQDGDQDGQGAGQSQRANQGNQPGRAHSSGEGKQPPQGQPGKAAGREAGTANINDPRQLAQQALDRLMESQDFRDEIERTRKTIFRSQPADRLEVAKFGVSPVSAEMITASRRFEREMRKIREVVEPGWIRRIDSGRINAGRFVREGNRDTAYDQWDEGQQEAIDIEAVICVDQSGSMEEHIRTTEEAMWGIKRALDQVDASTTVILYDAGAKFLYKSHEKASRNSMRFHFDGGGTEASDAVYQAASILASSKRSIKIFIILTDGDWSTYKAPKGHPRNPDELIKRMSKAGYITALGFVHTGYGPAPEGNKINAHNCEIKQSLSVQALPNFGRAIVRGAIAKKLVRR